MGFTLIFNFIIQNRLVMRLKLTKKILLAFTVVAITTMQSIQAQDFTDIFKAPQEDAEAYLNEYIEPFMLSFANGMAGGWYNTAKAHKPLGFDITLSVNVANIPSGERTFLFDQSKFLNVRNPGSADQLYPTLVGGKPDGAQLQLFGSYTDPNTGTTYTYDNIQTFDAPEGFDVTEFPIAGAPVPMLQVGLGLIKNTDLKFRYGKLSSDADGYDFDLLGIGLMHDFKQWIPGIKALPLDMSLFVGWSRFKTTVRIDEGDPSFSAQGEGEMRANTTTIQILASKKLSIFTPYVGVGYNAVSSSFKVTGEFVNYTLRDVNGNPFRIEDPADLNYEGGSGLRTTVGFRLKLAIITLHADYTIQKYNVFGVGLGIAVR